MPTEPDNYATLIKEQYTIHQLFGVVKRDQTFIDIIVNAPYTTTQSQEHVSYMKKTSKKGRVIHKTMGHLPVLVQEDELGGFWVTCPVLQGCYSQGETIDEALNNIHEAINLCLEDLPENKHEQIAEQQVSLHFIAV